MVSDWLLSNLQGINIFESFIFPLLVNIIILLLNNILSKKKNFIILTHASRAYKKSFSLHPVNPDNALTTQ